MRVFNLFVFLLLSACGAFAYDGTFFVNSTQAPFNRPLPPPPESPPEVLECKWLVRLVRLDEAEQKWVYHLSFRQATISPGHIWINTGVSLGGTSVGVTKVIFYPTPGPNEADVLLLPDTQYVIKQYAFDGSGAQDMASPIYFTTPALLYTDPSLTRTTDLKARADTCSPGMAAANAHLKACSLNITDMPLTYAPPFGPAIDFTLTYNHREASQPATFNYSNLGPKWLHNWMAFVDERSVVAAVSTPASVENPDADPPTPASPGSSSQSVLIPTVALPGGGFDRYDESPAFPSDQSLPLPNTFTNLRDPRTTLVKVAGGYEQRHPDGSKLVFGRVVPIGTETRYLLTQFVDRFGQAVTLAYDSSNRIVSLTDAAGGVTTLSYEHATDPLKITRITDPFGRYATIDYNANGQLSKITDVIGLVSEFAYQDDFITTLTTPYGTSTFAFGENGNDRWLTLTDPQGGVERVEYRDTLLSPLTLGALPAGMLTTSSDDTKRYTLYWSKKAMLEKPNDPAAAHLYHWLKDTYFTTSGRLMDEKPPLENRVIYNYEGQSVANYEGTSGRVTAVGRVLDDATSQVSHYQYDTFGNMIQSIDPLGRQTDLVYDANGLDLLEVRQKTGASQYDVLAKATYTAQHLPSTTTDAAGQTTTFTYNSAGQVRTITNAKNETTTLWYHATGQIADPTLDPGATGYPIQIDGAVSGATTKIVYDAHGRPRTVTDSEGYALTTDYDAFDRPRKVTFPDATYQEMTYDRLDTVTLRDRRGRLTQMSYNAVRQLEKVIDPLYRVTRYDWCTCGALSSLIDPLGQKTTWFYDIQSRVVTKLYQDESSVTHAYENATSRLKSTIDAKGQVTNYHYFGDNALQQVSYTHAAIATPTVSFTYDANYPRLATMTDGLGTTTYSYNPVPVTPTIGAGRLMSIDGPLANDTISYVYDELGRVLSRAIDGSANTSSVIYDALGRVTSMTNPLGTFGLDYVNTTGRLDHMDYPNGQRTNYGYFNNAGDQRLQSITNLSSLSSNLSTFTYTYDAESIIQSWSRQFDAAAALTSSFDYDTADQLTEASVPSISSVIRNYVYRYDHGGNRRSEQIDNAVTSGTHNNANQLTALSPSGPVRFEGALDEPANVTVNGVPATVDATNTFSADVALAPGTHTVSVVATDGSNNASTRNYEVTVASGASRVLVYDLNGNLTNNGAGQIYEWDAADRLVKITQGGNVTEFVYDGQSRRVQEKLNSTLIKQWIWCDGPQPCEERDGSNAVTKRFYAGLGQQIGSTVYFYTTDHLGSVREMTDGTGAIRARYDYDPYGRVTKVSGDLEAEFGFTGFYRHQASGLSLAFYRAYDGEIGRWLSRDPIEEKDGPNLYAYVGNDPINQIDPLGLNRGASLVQWANRTRAGRFLERHADRALSAAQRAGRQAWQWGKNLCQTNAPQLGSKLDFPLGKASGPQPGITYTAEQLAKLKHNVDRSIAMLKQLESVGLPDTPATRQFLTQHLDKVLNNSSNILRTQANGNVVRESLLMGPQGSLKLQTFWDGPKLITVEVFGGKL